MVPVGAYITSNPGVPRRSQEILENLSYRRGNGRQHPRGNQKWNEHARFNNMQAQRGNFRRGFAQPLHASNPFMPPQMHFPVRPFGNNFMYPVLASPMFYVKGPTPSASVFLPMQPRGQDPDLPKKILKQIDYYFSDENLVKDIFLRQNMDEEGRVPIELIASFKKVSCLTKDLSLILDAMLASEVVEVLGGMMRKRNGWMRWPIPRSLVVESFSNKSNLVAN